MTLFSCYKVLIYQWYSLRPLLVVGGSADTSQEEMGAFQELPQVEAARPYCKFSARPSSIEDLPFYVEKVKLYIM